MGSLPISVGIKNPSGIVKFVEDAEQLTSRAKYADFLKRQAAVKAKTGVDLNSLLSLVTGDAAVSSDGHVTMIRGQVATPAPPRPTSPSSRTTRRRSPPGP